MVLDTHKGSLEGKYNLPDMCCFLSWSCQIGCHTQLFSSLSKGCSLDLDSCSPCHIMYRRWWPHSHYSLQPHSLTPLWQHSNDMAVGWFDGITNLSPQQKEDEREEKRMWKIPSLLVLYCVLLLCSLITFFKIDWCKRVRESAKCVFSYARGMALQMAITVCPSLWSRLK